VRGDLASEYRTSFTLAPTSCRSASGRYLASEYRTSCTLATAPQASRAGAPYWVPKPQFLGSLPFHELYRFRCFCLPFPFFSRAHLSGLTFPVYQIPNGELCALRTRTNTNPKGIEASAASRSVRVTLRASQNVKRAEVMVGARCALWVGGAWASAGVEGTRMGWRDL
jgi:hypothetical protein